MGADGHTCQIYTYSKGIKDLGSIGLQDIFYISDNPKYPGLFYCSYAYSGAMIEEYATIKGNKLTQDIIYQTTVKPASDGVIYPDGEVVVTTNKKTFVAESRKEIQLPYYSISDSNIADIIYKYGKTQPTTPHPYATALSAYFKDATGDFAAYLEDINGDGVKEMLANNSGGSVCERLFYLYKGKLCTYDIDRDLYVGMFFSSNKHLILEPYHGDGGGYSILTIKNGKVTVETTLRSQLGNYASDTKYYQDNKEISESAYNKLLKEFGVSLSDTKKLFVVNSNNRVVYNRQNQTAKILAMTTDVKVTGITLNKSSIKLAKGKTYALKATIAPTKATTKAVKWTSSNPKVATVDKKGNVKAIGKGTATINATATDGSKVMKTCTVIVK
jgi:hypothetical protein